MRRAMWVTGVMFDSFTHSNLQKCPIGFVFLDDYEAKIFYNNVKNNKDVRSCELRTSGYSPFVKQLQGNRSDRLGLNISTNP